MEISRYPSVRLSIRPPVLSSQLHTFWSVWPRNLKFGIKVVQQRLQLYVKISVLFLSFYKLLQWDTIIILYLFVVKLQFWIYFNYWKCIKYCRWAGHGNNYLCYYMHYFATMYQETEIALQQIIHITRMRYKFPLNKIDFGCVLSTYFKLTRCNSLGRIAPVSALFHRGPTVTDDSFIFHLQLLLV